MTTFEWIIVIIVSLVIVFFGFAGVTGSYFFDKQNTNRENKKNANKN